MHPQDEVLLYESKGKAIAEAREGGHIPGLGPAWSHYNSSGYSADSNFNVTDQHTSPMASQYSEQLAYMHHIFFIGDHAQMVLHLKERIVMANTAEGAVKENNAIINAVDIDPLKDVANMTSVNLEGKHKDKQAELPTTLAITSMIANGQLQTSVNGVNIQNGLATQINVKVATGEEIPKDILVPMRQQYMTELRVSVSQIDR